MKADKQSPRDPEEFDAVDRSAEIMRGQQHCPRCRREYNEAELHDAPRVRCAFANTGVFSPDNYSCGALTQLRDLAGQINAHNDDENACLLPDDVHCGSFILITWYKSRGRTQGLWLVNQSSVTPVTYQQIDEFLNANGM